MSYSNSIILGKGDSDKFYIAEGYQHILLLAPHGSGKGVSFVVPTLLTLQESCIIHDIKLENYQLTSGYRESIGHKIFVFNPLSLDRKTHRYNPFDFISSDPNQKINDIQKIANLLTKSSEARILFLGLTLYLSAIDGKQTIGEITRMLNRDLEQELSNGLTKIDKSKNAYCFEIVTGFLNQSQETKSDAICQLRESLYLWTNPLVDYATSESDFDIASFKKSKATLYVGLNPDDIERLQPLMTLFYNHAFERLVNVSDSTSREEINSGVTVILDEFCTIGKLEKYLFGYLRGYKVRLFNIASDIGQIEEVYGKNVASSIISDCDFKIFFASKDHKTAQYVSLLCLDKNTDKECLSSAEVMNLHQDSQIILLDKEQPIICKKMKYYEDEDLKRRIKLS